MIKKKEIDEIKELSHINKMHLHFALHLNKAQSLDKWIGH